MFRIILPNGKHSKPIDRDAIVDLHKRGKIPERSQIEYRVELKEFLADKSYRASRPQKAYAESLGIEFPPDISSKQISALIDQAREKQLREDAERLRNIPDGDQLLSEATPDEIVSMLEARHIPAVLLSTTEDSIGILASVVARTNVGNKQWQISLIGNHYFADNPLLLALFLQMARQHIVHDD